LENRNAKSLLAKLMAAEDINVEYSDKAATASFDTESRTLRMPVFKDISDDSTDLFLGHEVGHALYTPQGEIHKVLEKGGTYKNFVNIVEDARIEKMIQNKFPGLRRCFFGGYNELMERDFFGTNGQDINEYNFIDRLNIHFKAGVRAGVNFSLEESIFVDRMSALRTWEDTISLSDDLYEYCKAREEEPLTDKTSDSEEYTESDESGSQDSQMDSDGSGEDTKEEESSQGESDSGKETDDNSESDSDSDTEDNRESDGESDTGGVEGDGTSADNGNSTSGKKGTEDSTDQLTSKTQESFDSKLEDLVDTESIRTYYNIPNVDLDTVIVPMSEIHQNMDKKLREENALSLLEVAAKKFKEFSNEQKSIISYLIKEFEMRKSADEHKRTKVARTGILNPNKLHAFKFSEDIFLRNSVVSDGKNHGFVMFVDWSGSMVSQMADTLDQLMMLALFCKKAQIPFDVYAFTTSYGGQDQSKSCGGFYQFDDLKDGDLGIIDNFNLLHLISSTLKTSAFNRSMTYVSYLRHMFAYHTSYNSEISWELIGDFMLGGTPLNEAIITAMSIVPQFQKNNNVQIVNTIFLTDGQGQNKQYRYESDIATFQDPYGRPSESVIVDPVTKKHYNGRITDKILLEILKDRTGTTLAGFFISTSNKKSFSTDCWHMNVPWDQVSRLWDSMKANGFCVVETNGYDEYYILASKNLRIENNGLDGIKSDMTKGKMKNAFVKAQQGKIANKKMLSKFAELVA